MVIKILAMAFDRKIAIRYIRSKAYPIAKHIFLLRMYAKDENVNHWLNELTALLDGVQHHTHIREGKRIDYEFIFNTLYNEPLEDEGQRELETDRAFQHMKEQPYIKINDDFRDLYSMICHLITSNRVVTKERIKEILNRD